MLGRTKGVAATTIVAILGIAGVGITSIFVISELKGFLQFVLNNWLMLFVSVLGLGIVAIGVINSFQKDPQWKKDVAGLGLLLALLFIIPVVVPVAYGLRPGADYSADLSVTLWNGYGGVAFSEVSVSNFQTKSVLNIQPMSIWPSYNAEIEYEVLCGGERVDDGGFGTEVPYLSHKEEIQVIRNLPEGGNCEVRLDLYNEEDTKVDDEVHVFTVPRGEDE